MGKLKLAVSAGASLVGKGTQGDPFWKKILGILLGVLILFFVIAGAVLAPLSALSKGDTLKEGYDITANQAYQEVEGIYREYTDDLRRQMEDLARQKLEEKAESLKQAGGPIDKTLTADIRLNHASLKFMMAFVSIEEINDTDFENFTPGRRKTEIRSYFQRMNRIRITDRGDSIEVTNEIIPEENILRLFYQEDEDKQSMLAASAELYAQLITQVRDSEDWYVSERVCVPGLMPGGMEIPLYYQWAEPWRSCRFGGNTISTSGCSVTCLAMVFSYLKQQEIHPDEVAAFAGNKWYCPPAGQGWGIFSGCSRHWDVRCTNIGTDIVQMVEALENGEPVISSMRPGTFTRGGHFIVLRGITENGGILVNDPNDNMVKNFAEREFPLSLIVSESKNFWKFSEE